ncbi:hypothetical protein VE03_00624 [Pseudogymnoascus sp. 23342-1-I1]|nr:hypothetical protein VE03_00624 [Pseudogymnoascus sp. 23342-1-I1]
MGKLRSPSLSPPSRWRFQWRDAVILLLVILTCASYWTSIPAFTPKTGSDDLFGANNALEQDDSDKAEHGANLTIMPEGKKEGDTLESLIDAVDVMQSNYFQVWAGLWPTAIDWTSAVIATHIAAAMSTISSATNYVIQPGSGDYALLQRPESLINRFMSHLMGFYFGQDALTLRSEAYDDMLWVVLGWLESIKFVDSHSAELLYAQGLPSWYGEEWVPGFAHRARIFWDLASGGWDASACGGGMVWSPYLLPYKNAITNQLFITASISMYLNFPGDDNASPFRAREASGPSRVPIGKKDPKFLDAAIAGYEWLASSNMRNSKGLYIDGFHISHNRHGHTGEQHMECNIRNEMVYTYNQGVLLSGQRGLWEATGSRAYLDDGHALISSVINATGFNLASQSVYTDEAAASNNSSPSRLGTWHGIGRHGILEEACDAYGTCSQDAQTFKGIFFHHFALFCAPLPAYVVKPGETVDVPQLEGVKAWHVRRCGGYGAWVRRNAEAARGTVSERGEAGMWWGAHLGTTALGTEGGGGGEIPEGAVDYRNSGVPGDGVWGYDGAVERGRQQGGKAGAGAAARGPKRKGRAATEGDANDRGRGRTVETQAGLVAVLRAAWGTTVEGGA